MKEIKAFVRPRKVEQIIPALNEAGFPNITISLCEGTGKYSSEDSTPSVRFHITDSEVAKLEVVCKPEDVETIVKIIREYGTTPKQGDGIIYVSEVGQVWKVKIKKQE